MTYRQDDHQPRNVYRDQQYIGVMFTAEDAALVVEALNAFRPHATGGIVRTGFTCTDEWQSTHRAGSRPNMCATCSETSVSATDHTADAIRMPALNREGGEYR